MKPCEEPFWSPYKASLNMGETQALPRKPIETSEGKPRSKEKDSHKERAKEKKAKKKEAKKQAKKKSSKKKKASFF